MLFTVGIMAAAGISTASAAYITIDYGIVGGSGDVDNVLFNEASLPQSGSLVQGSLNSTNGAFIVNFESNEDLQVSGGQASLSGTDGNFTDLCFYLSDGATFTKAILNPDVLNSAGDGTINFTVYYLINNEFMESFGLTSNGNNYFTVLANEGAQITKICFNSEDTVFSDTNQIRVGGAQPATRVPDGGTTIAMLGMALLGLGGVRKALGKR
jgi:hypothetical protein